MKHETTRRLGERVRLARAEKRMTQQQVADQLGVTRQAVNLWETGKSWPQARTAYHLGELLGLDIPLEPDLMDPAPKKLPTTPAKALRYAARSMSETLTQLLLDAEALDELEGDAGVTAQAMATTQAHAAASAAPSGQETAPRRRRKG